MATIAATAWGQSPPQQFTANFTNGAQVVTVDFERYSIRSPNFSVVVQNSSGALIPYSALESATFLGTPAGLSGAVACATRRPNGTILARIFFEDGATWTMTTGTMAGGLASPSGNANWPRLWPAFTLTTNPGSSEYAAEVGIDSSWLHFNRCGLSVDETLAIIEHSVLSANVLYLREAGILHRIGRVVIRGDQSVDPYKGMTGGALLDETRRQWNDVLPPGTHDIAAMLSTSMVGGGLAWVGVVGTSSRYSVNDSDPNGDFSVIWRHEAGHNWGSGHYEGGGRPEGPTVMSDNSLSRFSSSELSRIISHRNTKFAILDRLAPFAFSLPPRASMDRVSAAIGSMATIDVLANDHDGNGNSISILSFDAASNLGSPVTRSVGTGPGGRDRLSLAAVGDHGQADWFQYRIVDNSGRTATGIVYVQGENPSTKLAGSAIGTAGSWGNNSAARKEAALDGNLATFYDAANESGDWVGRDLGPSSLVVTKIKFASRSGFEWRLNGGAFQASNVADFSSGVVTLFTISDSPPSGMLTTQTLANNTPYRYVRYLGPAGGFCNIAELEFWGGAPSAPNRPNGLAAAGVHSGQIELSWNPTVLTTSYTVRRATASGGPYTTVASGITSTTFGDAGLIDGKSYYYVVSALNEIGESANSAEASAVASPTPSSDWRFNDGFGFATADSSPAKHHGAINGAAWTSGFAGTALQFNGVNSSVTFGSGPSVSGTNNFSVSAWIKTAGTARAVIIQQRDADGFNGEFQLSMNAAGTLQFMVYGDSAYQFDFPTTRRVNDGAWHHVVAVRSGLTGAIYIDGNPTPAGRATGPAVRRMDATITVAVGRDTRDHNLNFNGIIDEVRIYKTTALSASEAQGLYLSYFAPVQPQITSRAILPNGAFSIGGIGGNGQTYVLRAAASLAFPIAWSPIQTNTASAAGVFLFTDPEARNFPNRFYLLSTP